MLESTWTVRTFAFELTLVPESGCYMMGSTMGSTCMLFSLSYCWNQDAIILQHMCIIRKSGFVMYYTCTLEYAIVRIWMTRVLRLRVHDDTCTIEYAIVRMYDDTCVSIVSDIDDTCMIKYSIMPADNTWNTCTVVI
eukprot:1385918-Amorphochlora_amoeboformis.AAC.1